MPCRLCKRVGHTARKCPDAPPPPAYVRLAAPPADPSRPFDHVIREHLGADGVLGVRHTWRHRETGATIVAESPRVPLDHPYAAEGMVARRQVASADCVARSMPHSLVVEKSANGVLLRVCVPVAESVAP